MNIDRDGYHTLVCDYLGQSSCFPWRCWCIGTSCPLLGLTAVTNSLSDLAVQHLEQASRGNSRLASTWRQLILASTMRPAGMLTSLTWSARNAPQSHSPTSPPSGFVYYHTSSHSSDKPLTTTTLQSLLATTLSLQTLTFHSARTVSYDASVFHTYDSPSPLPQHTCRCPSHHRTTLLVEPSGRSGPATCPWHGRGKFILVGLSSSCCFVPALPYPYTYLHNSSNLTDVPVRPRL